MEGSQLDSVHLNVFFFDLLVNRAGNVVDESGLEKLI